MCAAHSPRRQKTRSAITLKRNVGGNGNSRLKARAISVLLYLRKSLSPLDLECRAWMARLPIRDPLAVAARRKIDDVQSERELIELGLRGVQSGKYDEKALEDFKARSIRLVGEYRGSVCIPPKLTISQRSELLRLRETAITKLRALQDHAADADVTCRMAKLRAMQRTDFGADPVMDKISALLQALTARKDVVAARLEPFARGMWDNRLTPAQLRQQLVAVVREVDSIVNLSDAAKRECTRILA